MEEISISTTAKVGFPALALVLALIWWTPALVGFTLAIATALAWCCWVEAHPNG